MVVFFYFYCLWGFFVAFFSRVRAPWSKPTTLNLVNPLLLPLRLNTLKLPPNTQIRNTLQEHPSVRMQGIPKNPLSITPLHNPTPIHNNNLITNIITQGQIMSNKNHGSTKLIPKLPQQVKNINPSRSIKHGNGLISN
ncbi:137aa long hypothetical protein [Pyrococcus horikoshii OT3]|uniref:Uncharacterized protein n=1 Tax=Pyrococcus horikoshii (strain ATCC 700860 / DSM 12428 / JCM 9974 / NBRC 100139 / OT-3) TaxID=70601 RepID=O58245_PYRHO|nr:137aa long hypothetical protein [Pyrococcus horikoshii OT3]